MSIIKPEAEQGHAESVTCEQRVLAFEQWCRDTTPCWNCNHIFPAGQAKCDSCGATNANVDFHQASLECTGQAEIEEIHTTTDCPIHGAIGTDGDCPRC